MSPTITPQTQIALQSTYFLITSSLVALRFWALQLKKKRSRLSHAIMYSNLVILIVWVISTAGEAVFIKRAADVLNNRRKPVPEKYVGEALEVTEENLESSLKQNLFIKTIYITLLWLCKSAFLSFYFDLHAYLSIPIRRCLYLVTAYTALTYIASLVTIFAWCRPFSSLWAAGEANCTPFHSATAVSLTSVFNITTDLLIMTLPLGLLKRRKRLHHREKVSMLFIFSLGIITVLAAIARFALVMSFISAPGNSLFDGLRIEWYELVAQLECLVAFVATCLPSLRVLLFRVWYKGCGESGVSFGERILGSISSGRAQSPHFGDDLEAAKAGSLSFGTSGSEETGQETPKIVIHSSPKLGTAFGLGSLGGAGKSERSLRREASEDLLNASRELIEAHTPRSLRERDQNYYR